MQNLRKYLQLFLGWYPGACAWLSLEGFWDTTNPIFETCEVRYVNFIWKRQTHNYVLTWSEELGLGANSFCTGDVGSG